jgi:hypothetical protein
VQWLLNGLRFPIGDGREKYCKWTPNSSIEKIRREIDKGYAIITSIKNQTVPDGHILTIVGYTEKALIVNDTYGNFYTGYKDTNGCMIEYENNLFKTQDLYLLYIHSDLKLEL